MHSGLSKFTITRPLAIIYSDKDKWNSFLPVSASLIHFCKFAFCHSTRLFASLGHGSGWKILGRSTYEKKLTWAYLKKHNSLLLEPLLSEKCRAHREGKPAALMRIVSRTPQALSCCTALFSSNLYVKMNIINTQRAWLRAQTTLLSPEIQVFCKEPNG